MNKACILLRVSSRVSINTEASAVNGDLVRNLELCAFSFETPCPNRSQ